MSNYLEVRRASHSLARDLTGFYRIYNFLIIKRGLGRGQGSRGASVGKMTGAGARGREVGKLVGGRGGIASPNPWPVHYSLHQWGNTPDCGWK
jgi:hypothetical protein